MLEHLPKDYFSEDLIEAHLGSEVGRGELSGKMNEAMKELEEKNQALAVSIRGALTTAPSTQARYGFLSGVFYILTLLDRKLGSEGLGRTLR
jgi:hypothetical protein